MIVIVQITTTRMLMIAVLLFGSYIAIDLIINGTQINKVIMNDNINTPPCVIICKGRNEGRALGATFSTRCKP